MKKQTKTIIIGVMLAALMTGAAVFAARYGTDIYTDNAQPQHTAEPAESEVPSAEEQIFSSYADTVTGSESGAADSSISAASGTQSEKHEASHKSDSSLASKAQSSGASSGEESSHSSSESKSESGTESGKAESTDTDTAKHITVKYDGVWELILVNRWNSIPEGYSFEVVTLDNGRQLDARIYDSLQQMFDDAREQGIYPVVGEAYRTSEEQKAMMQSYIDGYLSEGYDESEAKRLAEQYVALPGTSEHELGLSLDINANTEMSSNEEVYEWLAENSYKYGFILRYPGGKESITGINYEPWHYRYVGTDAAREIYESGVCLEEYLESRQ